LPGTLPGPHGIGAFAGIKFTVSAVKYSETAMVASAMKIAAVPTIVGFVLGPPVALAGVLLAETVNSNTDQGTE
jgi:thioredoxin-like negative regulator of GroEL